MVQAVVPDCLDSCHQDRQQVLAEVAYDLGVESCLVVARAARAALAVDLASSVRPGLEDLGTVDRSASFDRSGASFRPAPLSFGPSDVMMAASSLVVHLVP